MRQRQRERISPVTVNMTNLCAVEINYLQFRLITKGNANAA